MLISSICFADVAAIDKPDAHGRTAIIYAILDGNLEAVRSLLDKGADTHVKDKLEGKTILMTACEKYYSGNDSKGINTQQNIIALLLDKGHVDIDEKDKHGSTALMRVAYRGHLKVLKFLIEHGAAVNVKNNYGSTPLFEAVHGCHYESGCRYQAVKILLDNGANVNVKDEIGHTPLYYSKHCKCEKVEIQKLLRNKGALDSIDTVREPLIITSPKNGETFKEGAIVNFAAELSPDFKGGIIDVSLMTPDVSSNCLDLKTHPRYACKFKIPPASPKTISLFAMGATPTGGISSEEVVINVETPKNITLKGLKTFATTIYFYHLAQNKKTYIKGIFSDGVERDIHDANSGTTYSSSNERVVTVNSDGLATAKGPGEAQIIVKNGDEKLVINAIVNLKE